MRKSPYKPGRQHAAAALVCTPLDLRLLVLALAPVLLAIAGCGDAGLVTGGANPGFSITPGVAAIDTNCAGCNAASASGQPVEQFVAHQSSGIDAPVVWSVTGGDPVSGPGSISAAGQYTPPSYLTVDRVSVRITARLAANPAVAASTSLTLTPGFLQPLTPENAAVGAAGKLTVTGYLAEAGGSLGIAFTLAGAPDGTGGGQGALSSAHCTRGGSSFTTCTVTYTAPALIETTDVTYLMAKVDATPSRTLTQVLLNGAGVSSNPAAHQAHLSTPIALGSSGGNNNDYDAHDNQIVDCCGGTLGALVQDNSGRQYLLSNNHVLARSDHANVGDAIVQPGLIDNNCTPYGDGSGIVPVASLTEWLPLRSSQTNVDAAIAQVNSGAVNAGGSILELGPMQSDGTLAAAPPGVTSSGGTGEAASLLLRVAKSGRTTGLTCGTITALGLDVSVDYYRDCAETQPYLTRIFTNQIAISGNQFSDAGDSGALVVDAANAEPVGLLFAGGVDSAGVSQAVASPAQDVLNELGTEAGSGRQFRFVGGVDHNVSCLNYGNSAVTQAQAVTLSAAQQGRAQQALAQARMLINRSTGILGVAAGKSSDHPGEAAVILYVDQKRAVDVPAIIAGVRTLVVPATVSAVAQGMAARTPQQSDVTVTLSAAQLSQALAVKQQVARTLLRNSSGFFAVGVGQSLDDPYEAALIVYVDRHRVPTTLPPVLSGLRTRYIFMDRLHVSRSYATHEPQRSRCLLHPVPPVGVDISRYFQPHLQDLF